MKQKAIVLLSGGMDSATALYWARAKGFHCRALSFNYGQRHSVELSFAKKLAEIARCPWNVIHIQFPWTKSSSLLNSSQRLPHHPPTRIGRTGIPSTYVPARNTVFLSFSLAVCDAYNIPFMVIGANAIDFSGYPDCRPAFFSAFERVASTGTRAGTRGRPAKVLAPLLRMEKGDIVRLGLRLKVPFKLTWSCYAGSRRPCLRCDACILRARGFKDAGVKDPLVS